MSMAERDGWIWLDGEFVPWREAKVHVLTHTLHYGLGVFEGIRAYPTARGAAIFRLDDHIRRLFASAHILGITPEASPQAVCDACRAVLVRNGLSAGGYLRPLIFLGAEKIGIDPAGAGVHVAVAAWPWNSYLGEAALENGIRAKIASFARHHVNVHMCRAKSVATYTNSILATREARSDGYDEAILLDTDGFVAEGAGENLFIVRDGALIEPATSSGLDGITRRSVLTLAADLGIPVHSRRLTRDELYIADEVLLTGTAAEVVPVIEVDRRRVGNGAPGAVTRALQTAYFAAVQGQDARHEDWLTLAA